ncbi:MAG: TPM domain-containing protein [Bacteroidota bacterium]
MRNIVLGFMALLLLIALSASPALGADFPALTGRVVDNADLFSEEEEAEMAQVLADLEAASTDQIVVATIDSTGGQEISMYGTDLFNQWKLGQKGKDNGALLLIAVSDRQAWITTGYGIEDRLTDARCGDIYRAYIQPFFKEGRYFEGTKAALAQMMAFAAPEFRPAFRTGLPQPATSGNESASVPFIVILFIIFWILGSIGSRGRSRRYWSRRGFSSGGGFWGGGFGGGGGFSGGGGGFSGGGGRSGGGGAGGGW